MQAKENFSDFSIISRKISCMKKYTVNALFRIVKIKGSFIRYSTYDLAP